MLFSTHAQSVKREGPSEKRKHANITVAAIIAFLCGFTRQYCNIAIIAIALAQSIQDIDEFVSSWENIWMYITCSSVDPLQ